MVVVGKVCGKRQRSGHKEVRSWSDCPRKGVFPRWENQGREKTKYFVIADVGRPNSLRYTFMAGKNLSACNSYLTVTLIQYSKKQNRTRKTKRGKGRIKGKSMRGVWWQLPFLPPFSEITARLAIIIPCKTNKQSTS